MEWAPVDDLSFKAWLLDAGHQFKEERGLWAQTDVVCHINDFEEFLIAKMTLERQREYDLLEEQSHDEPEKPNVT